MRFDTPKPLSAALQDFLDKFPQKKRLKQGMVLAVWESVVGEKIAEQVKEVHFENSKLIVTVSNQVWRHEIHSNRFRIAKKINERIKAQVVGDIIVRS